MPRVPLALLFALSLAGPGRAAEPPPPELRVFAAASMTDVVNELAPRPHNSGHWSIDGAVTSQFEQFVRAVCGLPLGSVERHSDAVMKNLLGDEVEAWREILAEPGAKLHLYGKAEARPGRKMGHVTRLTPKR